MFFGGGGSSLSVKVVTTDGKSVKLKVGPNTPFGDILAEIQKKLKVDTKDAVLYWEEGVTYIGSGCLQDRGVPNGATLRLEAGVAPGSGLLFGASIESGLKAHPTLSIPIVVERAIHILSKRALETQGLFRIAGSMSDVENLKIQYDRGGDPDLHAIVDPHCIAGVLKLYLRSLPDPLLTFKLYDIFIDVGCTEDRDVRIKLLASVVLALPSAHLALLHALSKFLFVVADNSEVNKMSYPNLSTVFGPNLLRKQVEDIQSMIEHTPIVNQVVSDLIQFYELIFEPSSPPLFISCARVSFPFAGDASGGELVINAGDLVFINHMDESGWCQGTLRGVVGVFPASYCTILVVFQEGSGVYQGEAPNPDRPRTLSMPPPLTNRPHAASTIVVGNYRGDDGGDSVRGGSGDDSERERGGGTNTKAKVLAEVKQLRESVARNENERLELASICKTLQGSVASLEAKLAAANEQVASVKKDRVNLESRASSRDLAMSVSSRDPTGSTSSPTGGSGNVADVSLLEDLRKQLAAARGAATTAQIAGSSLLTTLDKERESHAATLALLKLERDRNGALMAEAAAQASFSKNVAGEAGQYREEIKQLQVQLQQLKGSLQDKDAALAAAAASLKDAETERVSLSELYGHVAAELASERAAREALEGVRSDRQELSDKVKSLKSQVASLQSEKEDSDREVSRVTALLTTKSLQQQATDESLRLAHNELADREDELSVLKQKMHALVSMVQAERLKTTNEKNDLSVKITMLSRQLDDARGHADREKKALSVVSTEINEYRIKIRDLSEALEVERANVAQAKLESNTRADSLMKAMITERDGRAAAEKRLAALESGSPSIPVRSGRAATVIGTAPSSGRPAPPPPPSSSSSSSSLSGTVDSVSPREPSGSATEGEGGRGGGGAGGGGEMGGGEGGAGGTSGSPSGGRASTMRPARQTLMSDLVGGDLSHGPALDLMQGPPPAGMVLADASHEKFTAASAIVEEFSGHLAALVSGAKSLTVESAGELKMTLGLVVSTVRQIEDYVGETEAAVLRQHLINEANAMKALLSNIGSEHVLKEFLRCTLRLANQVRSSVAILEVK